MTIKFENGCAELSFDVAENKIYLKEYNCFGKTYVSVRKNIPHSYVYIIGGAYVGKYFNRYGRQGENLNYVSHSETSFAGGKELTVVERNAVMRVETVYTLYDGCAVLKCSKKVVNTTKADFCLECVSPLVLTGIMDDRKIVAASEKQSAYREEISIGATEASEKYVLPSFWQGYNTWTAEACFEKKDLNTEGLRAHDKIKKCGKITVVSNGTQTTNNCLPMGIFEKSGAGFFYFELMPEGSWSYEMETGAGDFDGGEFYLALTGKTFNENAWFVTVAPNGEYVTDPVRILGGEDLDSVAAQLTKIRRITALHGGTDTSAQIVYNNFQQNTYGRSNENDDGVCIPFAAEYGADYYVLDAGWHDYAENGRFATHEIGEWKENPNTYPSGLVSTVEKIRNSGMKFGLWLELQSVGIYCRNENLLPENCFFRVNGVRPQCNCRYQLDYSKKRVRDYADGIVENLVKKYNPEYIKIDYNQTQQGNDCETGSLSEGVCKHSRAYNEWFRHIREKYPDILFESCASGGMKNDAYASALSQVISVSDQSEYLKYPIILSNLFLTLLPEQCGIWNMPVRKFAGSKTSDEEVVMNVINSLYGVMHLSSRLEFLNDAQKKLLKEGIAYYRSLAKVKNSLVPIFPHGITLSDAETFTVALRSESKIYMSVYNVSSETRAIKENLKKYGVKDVKLVYPSKADNEYSLSDGEFSCILKSNTARSFEFTL